MMRFRRKINRYSDPLILSILRKAEGGVAQATLCRDHGMSSTSFYKWRVKFGGMDASMISQMRSIEDENRQLKKMFAELSMQNELLKEALEKNRPAIPTPRDGRDCSGAARGQHCAGLPDVRCQLDLSSLQPAAER